MCLQVDINLPDSLFGDQSFLDTVTSTATPSSFQQTLNKDPLLLDSTSLYTPTVSVEPAPPVPVPVPEPIPVESNNFTLSGSLVSSANTQPVFNLVFSSQSPLVQAIQSVPIQTSTFTQQPAQPQIQLITTPIQQPQQTQQPKTLIIDNSQALQKLLEGLSQPGQTFTIQQQPQQQQQQQQQQHIIQPQQQQQQQQQRSGPRPLQPVKQSNLTSSRAPPARIKHQASSSPNLDIGGSVLSSSTAVYAQQQVQRSASSGQVDASGNRRSSTGSIGKNVRFSTDGPFVVPANPVSASPSAPHPKVRQVSAD